MRIRKRGIKCLLNFADVKRTMAADHGMIGLEAARRSSENAEKVQLLNDCAPLIYINFLEFVV